MRRLRSRRSRKIRGKSFGRNSNIGAWLALGGVVLGVAAVVCVVIFVIVPLFNGNAPGGDAPELSAVATIQPVYSEPPKLLARDDMSDLAVTADSGHKSVNNPYIFGDEMVFTGGDASKLNPDLDSVYIYSLKTGATAKVEGIASVNGTLLFAQMNEKWIVYIDAATTGGGNVCAYDRQSGVSHVIRTYYYAIPRLGLTGDYLAFICQTSNTMDKMYLCDLTTRETVTMKAFSSAPAAVSGVAAGGGEIVWVQSANDEENTGMFGCVIRKMELTEGSDITQYDPGMYVYYPVTNGEDIAFMDANRSESARLYVSIDGGAPVAIVQGALNYAIGEDFVAYTLAGKVYVYFFADGSTGCVSGLSYTAELISASGNAVMWYDITDGVTEADVVRYARVGATAPETPDTVTPEDSPSPSPSPDASPETSPENNG